MGNRSLMVFCFLRRSLGEMFASDVPAEAWVCDSFVIVVVDVRVADYAWVLDTLQVLV